MSGRHRSELCAQSKLGLGDIREGRHFCETYRFERLLRLQGFQRTRSSASATFDVSLRANAVTSLR